MSDQIHLSRLRLYCHIGVPEAERAAAQVLYTDVIIHTHEQFEQMNDEIGRTIDYAAVALRLEQVAAEKTRCLIETLAADLAACVLSEFKAKTVEITLKKHILPQTDHVAVRIVRHAKNPH